MKRVCSVTGLSDGTLIMHSVLIYQFCIFLFMFYFIVVCDLSA